MRRYSKTMACTRTRQRSDSWELKEVSADQRQRAPCMQARSSAAAEQTESLGPRIDLHANLTLSCHVMSLAW
jgi:hypothetical protein